MVQMDAKEIVKRIRYFTQVREKSFFKMLRFVWQYFFYSCLPLKIYFTCFLNCFEPRYHHIMSQYLVAKYLFTVPFQLQQNYSCNQS